MSTYTRSSEGVSGVIRLVRWCFLFILDLGISNNFMTYSVRKCKTSCCLVANAVLAHDPSNLTILHSFALCLLSFTIPLPLALSPLQNCLCTKLKIYIYICKTWSDRYNQLLLGLFFKFKFALQYILDSVRR